MDGTLSVALLVVGGSISFGFGLLGKIAFDWLRNGRNGKNGKMPTECRDALKRLEGGLGEVKTSQQISKEGDIKASIYLKEIADSVKEQTRILQKHTTLLQLASGGGGGRNTAVMGDT